MRIQFVQQPKAEKEQSIEEIPVPPTPGEIVSVPPVELVAALRAIEARHQSEAAAAIEIATLARTLHQIGVTAAPREVWHELAARRTVAQTLEAQGTAEINRRRQERRRLRSAAIATLSLILIALSARTIIEQYRNYREEQVSKRATQQRLFSASQLPPPPQMTVMPVYESMFRMTPTTKPVGAIPNGMAFRSDFQTLSGLGQLLYGSTFQKPIPTSEVQGVMIETHPPRETAAWEAVRLDGKFYLRGWIKGRVLPSQLKPANSRSNWNYPATSDVTVYNSPEAGSALPSMTVAPSGTMGTTPIKAPAAEPLTQISIPLDGFDMHSSTMTQDHAMATLSLHHLDNHAYEPWQPLPLPPSVARYSSP